MSWLRRTLRRWAQDTSGVAMIEFAVSVPFLMVAGMWSAETANLAMTHLKVGQMAIQLADDASRVGDTSTLANRKIYELDINDVFVGSYIHGGKTLDFYHHGRAIISSLEVWGAAHAAVTPTHTTGQQFIHWQRCKGTKNVASSYGVEGDTMTTGMGPTGEQVSAEVDSAVIFVELVYDYQPLITTAFASNTTIRAISSFMVRDSRDISQIYQRVVTPADPQSLCSTYDASNLPTL